MQQLRKNALKPGPKFDLKRFTFFIFVGLAVIFIVMQAPRSVDYKGIAEFNRDLQNYNVKLQIIGDKEQKIAEFLVAVADDDYRKMYGLMNLSKLPQEFGMLFPFFKSQVITMWMKNTRIPLDMIFIDKNDRIVTIKTHAMPYSLDLVSSEKEAKKALEINGGLVEKLGIKIGQKVKIAAR